MHESAALHGRKSATMLGSFFSTGVRMPHRILVVDAHPLNRLVVAEQLATLGHAPLCVDDAEQALALLDASRFDLVVAACRMPGTDGFSLAARMNDLAIARGIDACPIIGYSSDASLDTPLSMQTGMRACLPMPIPLATLDALLRTVLRTRASAPATNARNAAQWDLFVSTSRDDLRAARACSRSGNLMQLRALFHRIKGAAMMLGENDVAASCARGEAGCEEWSNAATQAAIDLVEAQLDALSQYEPSR
jgi:two-component system sensor histidine kinase EvgS